MPKDNGIGHSNATRPKQDGFTKIIEQHLIVVDQIFRKYGYSKEQRNYIYIDATAGTGKDKDEHGVFNGSPLIFLDMLNKRKTCFEPDIHFIDVNKESQLLELEKNLMVYTHKREIHAGEYQKIIPMILKEKQKYFGLVYLDENGIPDLDFISELTKNENLKKIDVLFNYPATAKKRNDGVQRKKKDVVDFITMHQKINKTKWFVREPVGKWQWSFLFGCNTPNFKLTKALGFHDIESTKGKEILYRLNYTKSQYKNPNQSVLW